MDLTATIAAALADRYRIDRVLGTGGMATVFLAEDLKHRRQVAVKVLRPDLAANIGSERFLREIEIAARLAHPNILPLFDSGEAGGLLYYVMPYVSGDTLRERLARSGRLVVAEVVRILRDVLDGLAHAHAAGVVHRDITPGNILLSGRHAIVADFGIARALNEATGTLTVTAADTIIGTPSYMSPEQITAGPLVDHRSDIYSIGVVAYEMLAGTPPFRAATSHAVLAAHVSAAPVPLHEVRGDVPRPLADLVTRCLDKDVARRWQNADDLLQALESIGSYVESGDARSGADSPTTTLEMSGAVAQSRRWILPTTIASLAGLLLVAAILVWQSRPPMQDTGLAAGRITRLTNAPGLEVDAALSPDGRLLAYAAGPPGGMRLFLLDVAGGRTIPLTSGEAQHERWPRWSPDAQRLVFHAGADELPNARRDAATLHVVSALGGTPRRLGDSAHHGFTPAWSPDGRYVAFSIGGGVYGSGVSIVPADGQGPARRVAELYDVHSLRWSPDGKWIACVQGNPRFTLGATSFGNNATSSICLISVADGRVTTLTPGDAMDLAPAWMPDGRSLLFVSNRDGMRDIYRLALTVNAEAASLPVRISSGVNAHGIDLSADGRTLVYSSYTPMSHIWSVPIPKAGETSLANARQITFGSELVEGLALSPDGAWIAYDSDRSGNGDIWKVPAAGGDPVQLTTDPAGDYVQDWSTDGQELAFHTLRRGSRDVFLMAADGSGARLIAGTDQDEANPDLSPDGNAIAYDVWSEGTPTRVWIIERSSKDAPWGEPRALTGAASDPAWSPDGRHIAFVASGTVSVIARTGGDERVVVPVQSQAPVPRFVCWTPDGRTLLYKTDDHRGRSAIWAVPSDGGTPRRLIQFDDPARPSSRREFATDGANLYFTIAVHESDIWLMELRPR